MLAGPEQPWRDRQVQLGDEPRFEVLADGRHTAADLHILSFSCRRRTLQRLADTARDKVEDRAAFHRDRRATVMRQHKYRTVVGRVLPPPPAPVVIGPGTTNRAEHVASHDPCPDALPKTRRNVVIDARGAAGLTIDALERTGRDEPLVQSLTTDAEGILSSLTRPGAVSVERDRKVVHAHTRHSLLPVTGKEIEECPCALARHNERQTRPLQGATPAWQLPALPRSPWRARSALLVRWPWPDAPTGGNSPAPVEIRPRPTFPRTTTLHRPDEVTDMTAWLAATAAPRDSGALTIRSPRAAVAAPAVWPGCDRECAQAAAVTSSRLSEPRTCPTACPRHRPACPGMHPRHGRRRAPTTIRRTRSTR